MFRLRSRQGLCRAGCRRERAAPAPTGTAPRTVRRPGSTGRITHELAVGPFIAIGINQVLLPDVTINDIGIDLVLAGKHEGLGAGSPVPKPGIVLGLFFRGKGVVN